MKLNLLLGKKRRWIVLFFVIFFVFGVTLTPLLLRLYTALRFDESIYNVQDVPTRPIAIVFGARVHASGRLSTMLRDRVATAVELYHAGKVEKILMTGDNQSPYYDEPGAMTAYAVQAGVPEADILRDPLGLRTYDSCYRAAEIYGIREAILVTQDFHLDRALLLCSELGIDAVGVAADYHRPNGYPARMLNWSRVREIAATTVAYWDLIRRPQPASIP